MENLVAIKNLNVIYESKKNVFGDIQNIYAVNGVNIDVTDLTVSQY